VLSNSDPKAGFTTMWWGMLGFPVGVLMTISGFVVYRYRETRALTLAQFFEMRYSRRFRIFAGLLVAASGILNYGIFPAIGGRFFVYYCGLPETIHLGITIPTFAIVMFVFLGTALLFVLLGGQLTIMVTDCVQGLFSYAMYLVVALALMYMFSWHQISVALLSAPAGKSMVNPFHSFKLENFNVWYELIGIFGGVYTIMAWQGTQAFNCSAASAHEQKMGGMLGSWRGMVFEVMQTLLAICAVTYLTNHDFSTGAAHVQKLIDNVHGSNSAETDYLRTQMRIPLALAYFLPIGIKGIFAALMFFLACTNDVSYLHSWGSIVAQGYHHALPERAVLAQDAYSGAAIVHYRRNHLRVLLEPLLITRSDTSECTWRSPVRSSWVGRGRSSSAGSIGKKAPPRRRGSHLPPAVRWRCRGFSWTISGSTFSLIC